MHDYGNYCSLSWSLPVFCQPSPVLRMSSTRASNSQKSKFANCVHHTYLYVVYHRHSKVNCLCATFKLSKKIITCFVQIYSSWESSLKSYCGKYYVTYAFLVLISCLLCDNHAVMGNAINMSLLNLMWVAMNVHLVLSKGDYHAQGSNMHICQRKTLGR